MKHIVLVVDDEKRIADTLRLILASKGFQACAVYDGQAGIEKCREIHPDLIVSDVVMPGLNGLDMAIAVRAEIPGIPVLFLSGHSSADGLLSRARQAGHSFDYLDKPVHPEVLLERITRLLAIPRAMRAAAASQSFGTSSAGC